MELLFQANGVEEMKQVPALLTAIGGETYALLQKFPLEQKVEW